MLTGNYLPSPQGGFHPLNFFEIPTPSPTGGVKSSYTYPEKGLRYSQLKEATAEA